jgi:hemin uptake protein HemP
MDEPDEAFSASAQPSLHDPAAQWQASVPDLRPPQVDSAQIMRGHRTIEIHHNGALYRLQATRQGKLILTK